MTWRPGRRKTLAACRSFGRNFPLETFVKMLFQFVHVPEAFGKLPDSDSTCNEPPRHKPVQSILKLRLDHKKSIKQLRLTVNFPLFTRKILPKIFTIGVQGEITTFGTNFGAWDPRCFQRTRSVRLQSTWHWCAPKSSSYPARGSNPKVAHTLGSMLYHWIPQFLVQRSQKFYTLLKCWNWRT